jgi:serine/threonine protein kinase/tetratricopeptide (TPR) repeat protein
MDSSRWEVVTRTFTAALDRPKSERQEFVRQESKGDVDIEREVLKLLAADDRAGSFLEKPVLLTPTAESGISGLQMLSPGSVVSSRFEIVRFIGQGGMGQVYEAFDLELKVRVALKAIRPEIAADAQVLSRFKREVLLTRRITHPNVCRTFDIDRHTSNSGSGIDCEITFLTMELLEGETLADLLRRQGQLSASDALPVVLQIIDALGAAHNAGIIHRDLKPSNVILVPSQSGNRVVVTDFGLARAVVSDTRVGVDSAATTHTGGGGLMGTLVYMAPEQFERGEATVATDIYALGLVMYEMVTGQRPFADTIPFAEAAKRLKQPTPSLKLLVPELDDNWETAICKCLQLQPEARFMQVREIASAITGSERTQLTFPGEGRRSSGQNTTDRATSLAQQKFLRRKLAAAMIVLVTLLSLSTVLLRHYQVRTEAKLAGGSTVLLTEIQNSTGDKRFDGTTELIRHQLLQSPYFGLLDGGRIRKSLEDMGVAPDTPLIPLRARDVALRNGVPRIVFGAVSRVGDSYILYLEIEQPDNNTQRFRRHWESHWTWNVSSSVSQKEIPSGFLDAVRDSGDWIRSQIGESANDIARVDIPPQDVTTGNWEALSEFAQAEKFKSTGQAESAVVALQNAVAADPHFALAYMRLGDVLVSLSRFSEGYRAYRVALAEEQRQRLTRREKDRLAGIYANDTEDFAAAEAAFREYTVYYPNDYLGWFYRATPLMMMGRVEEAVTSLKKAAEIDPTKMFAPAHIARFDLILENYEDAAKWIQHLRDTGYPEDADLIEGESDFLQGRYEESLHQFETLRDSTDPTRTDDAKNPKKPTDPLYHSYAFSLLARLRAEQGQYQQALRALKDGIDADMESGDTVHRADKILDRAYINCTRGEYEGCMRNVASALDLDRSLQRSLAAGTVLGQAIFEAKGRTKLQLTTQLRKVEAALPTGDFKPLSDIVRSRLQGETLLADSKWKAALDEFRKADHLEAPTADKEYLARAFLEEEQITDLTHAARLRDGALAAYSGSALNPGRVWQLVLNHFPGESSHAFRAYVRLAFRSGKIDEPLKLRVARYIDCEKQSDTQSNDLQEAQRWLQQSGTQTTSIRKENHNDQE